MGTNLYTLLRIVLILYVPFRTHILLLALFLNSDISSVKIVEIDLLMSIPFQEIPTERPCVKCPEEITCLAKEECGS